MIIIECHLSRLEFSHIVGTCWSAVVNTYAGELDLRKRLDETGMLSSELFKWKMTSDSWMMVI